MFNILNYHFVPQEEWPLERGKLLSLTQLVGYKILAQEVWNKKVILINMYI